MAVYDPLGDELKRQQEEEQKNLYHKSFEWVAYFPKEEYTCKLCFCSVHASVQYQHEEYHYYQERAFANISRASLMVTPIG